MAARWKLTIRRDARVVHERFEDLDAALRALARQLDDARAQAPRKTAQAFARKVEPVAQVAARLELGRGLGRGVHGGIDVRGDGSAEAWRGLVRKRVVEPADGEDVVAALRRALTG